MLALWEHFSMVCSQSDGFKFAMAVRRCARLCDTVERLLRPVARYMRDIVRTRASNSNNPAGTFHGLPPDGCLPAGCDTSGVPEKWSHTT